MGTPLNDYEALLQALLDHIKSSMGTALQTCAARLAPPPQTPSQPALYMTLIATQDDFEDDGLGMVTLLGELWLYSRPSADPRVTPRSAQLALLKSIRDCFKPDNYDTGTFTIGRRVARCRIEGRTWLWPGDLDNQSVAKIPFTILVT